MSTTPAQEAERRYPLAEEYDNDRARTRRSTQRDAFTKGAVWQATEATEDDRVEAARIAGTLEAFDAIKGYMQLVSANMREGENPDWKRGVWALSGRLQHMIAEVNVQLRNDRPSAFMDLAKDKGASE